MEHGVRPSLNVQVGFRQFGNLLVQLDVALTKTQPSHTIGLQARGFRF